MARKTLAVIAARGGSKGIPHKNLLDLCGKPLIAWTVEQARAARGVDVVAVSSDSDSIIAAAEAAGAIGVRRPEDISGDLASSESAWLHALNAIDERMGRFERIVALQATSPIRQSSDIEDALSTFDRDHLDSLLSVCEVEDYFNWRIGASGPEPINYDYRNRRMRQQIEKRYLENGSFYVLIPSLLRELNNRLGGKIGFHVMDRHKMFQIDRPEDVKLCAAIMRSYGYA
ncbi:MULTISPECIES: acylneuraminate cytidylyltransferase family protein [unclassified Bradyrhizobium]|uniref:acylneuraminate cytidylyltransferase family protein n=1 Tax=unclassified Bradyrhizobium TaxID=2631580 RepID=UPI001FF7D568|nr:MULTISPECIES: acylneuraminate cytidylyltransferase family protein [unclassified Bradyrhizobium]MCK1483028.1 acylneuraminate cytidylyltransferase family protein [Bradyrhizobium sp. 193]MCK1504390.1 acylneuraminate cytidylyltransferase family protein [Bradyrhizobium sp. 18]MCK1582962.1 acylneuraminate cytidylyltransferase family protein [Bradyrhizobium sp. 168]UPK13870.1 acylneuraminate cytidylyltransferase family protein [Bradyrhizobium sp. 155]UPK17215.1 acylneuraminate cytidylyltransferase